MLLNNMKFILSVDDDDSVRYTRRLILEREGYKVFSAADGPEALGLFSMYSIDLILLDFSMPQMTGGELAQRIKMQKPHVPIIMVSGKDRTLDDLRFVDRFISKAEGPLALLKAVKIFL